MRRVLLVAALVAGSLLGGAWLLIPSAIERLAPDRIRSEAAARGVEIEWERARWLAEHRAFELRGVTLRHPRGEARVSVLRIIVGPRYQPRRVSMRHLVGRVELTGGRGGGSATPAPDLPIAIDGARIVVEQGGRPLGLAVVSLARLRGTKLVRAEARLEPADSAWPEVETVAVRGTEGEVRLLGKAGDLVDAELPGVGRLRIHEARVWRDGRLELREVELVRGALGARVRRIARTRAGWAGFGAEVRHADGLLARVEEARYGDGTGWLKAEVLGGTVEAAVSLDGSGWLSGVGLDLAHLPLPQRLQVRGRADVELSAALTGDTALARADLRVADVEVISAAIADDPLRGLAAQLTADLSWSEGVLALTDGRFRFGPTRTRFSARVDDLVDDPVVHLRSATEPVACDAALRALPKALTGAYAEATLSGTMSPTVRFDWPVHRPKDLALKIRRFETQCRVTHLNARPDAWPEVEVRGRDDVGWLARPFSLQVREGTTRPVFVGPKSGRYVPLRQLPRYLGAAMFLSEEIGFYRGHGINRGLIQRALRLNLSGGRFVYGGSTVTQQLVKNLFLTRRKTLARKLQEALVAERVTQALGKNRILELYVNCIEFGPNIYGVGPAAGYYFQKDARDLTPKEAVFLAMIKPAPGRGAAMRRRGHTPRRGTWWPSRAAEIFRRLVEHGFLTPAQAEAERPFHDLRWENGRAL